MSRKYWASRIEEHSREYFWSELREGRLRQGWGYDQRLDLRKIYQKHWSERDVEEADAFRQWRMMGGDGGWEEGDIVLVPKVPERGLFALVKITGPYDFKIGSGKNQWGNADFGHLREVRLLTPEGVSNNSEFVESGIRSTLRTPSRTWQISGRDTSLERVLAHANDPEITNTSRIEARMERIIDMAMQPAVQVLRQSFDGDLGKTFGNEEWEHVLHLALRALYPGAEVRHTGGASERGADLEFSLPNPLAGPPFIIVVQVKDWSGEAGPAVVGQLRQAIESRQRRNPDTGLIEAHVISAVLAMTNATPSAALISANCLSRSLRR